MVKKSKALQICFLFTLLAVLLVFMTAPAMAETVGVTVYDEVYLDSIGVTTENSVTPIGLRVPVEVTLLDQNGDLFTSDEAAEVVFTVADLSALSNHWDVYDASVGGTAIQCSDVNDTFSATVPAGESGTTVYFKTDYVGEYSISAALGELTGSVDITASLLPGSCLEMEVEADYDYGYFMDAGSRIGVNISLFDQFGNNPAYDAPITVSLVTNSPEGSFYASADSGDTEATETVELVRQDDGSVTGRVYYSDTLAYTRGYESEDYWGQSEITVTGNNLNPDYADIEVYPLNAVNIALEADGHFFRGIENEIQAIYVDKYGNPADYSEGQYFSVSSTGEGKFYQWGDQVSLVMVDDHYYYGYFDYVPDATGPATITLSSENTGMSAALEVEVLEYEGEPIRELDGGWKTLSFPFLLSDMSLNHILGPDRDNVEAIYGFADGQFIQITDLSAELRPLDAVFVKVEDGKTLELYFDINDIPTSVSAPPTKELKAGWNFVGPAVFEGDIPADANFASIEGKYSQVIYPGYDGDSLFRSKTSDVSLRVSRSWYPWVYVPGQDDYDIPYVEDFLGYWVFMKEDGTLAGFTFTPIPSDLGRK